MTNYTGRAEAKSPPWPAYRVANGRPLYGLAATRVLLLATSSRGAMGCALAAIDEANKQLASE